ncbi:hypothetical protein QYE76_071000 [Lolium multiflorum]|uniref:Uncharacterized protein n=1 Tax=Lolium multiflorum TaxID=4521 RepID=A0AAD8WF00_LOLMU|nr:hypothetical protein QYE76_071000 [Lolium multiflorum]
MARIVPHPILSGIGVPRSTHAAPGCRKRADSAWYDSTNNLTVTADTRKALFEELLWEHRELAEAHDKCQVIPEASIDALKEQLATAQREKDELSRQHQEELNALKTSYQELKSQLIQLGLDHAKALKAAEVTAAAKLDEAWRMLQCHRGVAGRAGGDGQGPEGCRGEGRGWRRSTRCDQLILQTDTLALRLFPDSQRYAVKKVDAQRKDKGQADLTVPWTPKDHLDFMAGEEVPDTFSLINDRLKGAGRRIREWRARCPRWSGLRPPRRLLLVPELNLDALVCAKAQNGSDPILSAKRQDRAYRIAEYADMRTFILPPPGVTDYLDEEEGAEEEVLGDAGAGDAPPEAPAA